MTVTVVRSVRATGRERGATRVSRLIMDQHVRLTVCQCWTNTTALVTVQMSLQFSKLNFLNFLIKCLSSCNRDCADFKSYFSTGSKICLNHYDGTDCDVCVADYYNNNCVTYCKPAVNQVCTF